MLKTSNAPDRGAIRGFAAPSPESATRVAEQYARGGLFTVPIPAGKKGPRAKGWTELRISPDQVDQYFKNDSNIGVLLGTSKIVDIDLDCREAIAIAPHVLPSTRTFGRSSKRASHWIYKVEDRRATARFQLPGRKGPETLCEYRDSSKDLKTSSQTVFPGSVHPSGQRVEWDGERGKGFTTVSADDLFTRTKALAGASALAKMWPRQQGGRQELAGALASVLARSECADWVSVPALVGAIARAGDDEEAGDREGFAERTVEALKDDSTQAVTGYPTLERLIATTDADRRNLKAALGWLGFQGISHSGSAQGASTGNVAAAGVPEWEAPEPLLHPSDRVPVDPFDTDLLPRSIVRWVEDESRQKQLPPDFGAACAIVSLSSAIGRRIGIRPLLGSTWKVIPNLWGLIIGRPGQMKSPVLKAMTRPLMRLQASANASYEAESRRFEAELQASDVHAAARKKAAAKRLAEDNEADVSDIWNGVEAPEPPARKVFVVHDATPEALVEIARDNPKGVLQLTDEASGLIAKLSDKRNAGERALYLSSWNGDERVSQTRIGRGHVAVEAICQSILGGIQPGKLHGLVAGAKKGGSGDDGLLQRFQVAVWPDPSSDFELVSDAPDAEARHLATRLFEALVEMDAKALGAEQGTNYDGEPEGVPYLRFDPDAQRRFDSWFTQHEIRLRKGSLHPTMEAHLAKFRSLVPSLALILHVCDGFDANTGLQGGAVGLDALERAIRFATYLESHARRVFSTDTGHYDVSARELGRHVLDGDLESSFSFRLVRRKGWSGLRAESDAQAALDVLEEHGWVRRATAMSGSRKTTVYEVNPALKGASKVVMIPPRGAGK